MSNKTYPTGEPLDSPDPDAGKFFTVTAEGFVEPRLGLSLADALNETFKEVQREWYNKGYEAGFRHGFDFAEVV